MGERKLIIALLCAQLCALLIAQPVPPFCQPDFIADNAHICSSFGLDTNNTDACLAVTIIDTLAVKVSPLRCNKAAGGGVALPPSKDLKGHPLPRHLPDLRPLPKSINAQTLETEGSTLFWYYRNVLNVENWAPCTVLPGQQDASLPIPKGWETVQVLYMPQGPEYTQATGIDKLPFGVLIKQVDGGSHPYHHESCKEGRRHHGYEEGMEDESDWQMVAMASDEAAADDAEGDVGSIAAYGRYRHDRYNRGGHHHHGGYGDHHHDNDNDEPSHPDCEDGEGPTRHSPRLVLLLRGSLSLAEWLLDGNYTQISTDPTYGPGSTVAVGFATVAEALWPQLAPALTQQAQAGVRTLTIAGHSLGSAAGQLLAVRAEALLKSLQEHSGYDGGRWHKPGPAVTLVSFGGPNVGNSAFAANFNAKINARSVGFEADAIRQIPCEPQMVACPSPPTAVNTANPPSNVWPFTRTGGNLVYPAAAMPFNSATNPLQNWSRLLFNRGPEVCNTTLSIGGYFASHVCSYLCMTSPYVGEANNLCWINPLEAPANGATACQFAGFP